jgi:hypothetical protein
MGLYHVQKVLFGLNNEASLRERWASDPKAVLADADLEAVERAALESGDVAALYAMGVHPLLLAPFAGRCGLAWPDYLATLAAVEQTSGIPEPR